MSNMSQEYVVEKEIGKIGYDYMIRVSVRDEKGNLIRECEIIPEAEVEDPTSVLVECHDRDDEDYVGDVVDLTLLPEEYGIKNFYDLLDMSGEEILEKVLK